MLHKCTDTECPFVGQRTSSGCGCHQTDEQFLQAEVTRLREALGFVRAATEALEGYEADRGEPLPDDHELGRIDDSRHSASFRIRVGHIRKLAAALSEAQS